MTANKDRRPNRHYVSIAEAAGYLSCSTKTIRRLVESGEIRAYRLNPRVVRVDLNEIENRMESS